MLRKYIPINSVADIDVRRVGLENIDNRYIDRDGNRFATRFNKRTRKVEVVRIVLGEEEARQARQNRIVLQTQQQKAAQPEPEVQVSHYGGEDLRLGASIPDWVQQRGILPDENIRPEEFYLGMEKRFHQLQERLHGILANIKSIEAFNEMRGEHGQDFILEITNYFDANIHTPLANALERKKEFEKYPRPSSQILGLLTSKQRDVVEQLSDRSCMLMLTAYLVGDLFLRALEASLQLIDKVLSSISAVSVAGLTAEKKQHLEDARVTAEFLQEEIIQEAATALGLWKVEMVI